MLESQQDIILKNIVNRFNKYTGKEVKTKKKRTKKVEAAPLLFKETYPEDNGLF